MRGMLSLLWIMTLIAMVAFFVLLIIYVIDKVKKRQSSVSVRALVITLVIGLMFLVATIGTTIRASTNRGLSAEKSSSASLSSDDDSASSEESEVDVDVDPDDNNQTATEVSPNISNNEPMAYRTDITYAQIAQAPADFAGEKVQFSGKVVKIVPTDDDDKVRLAVDGNPNNLMVVDVDKDLLNGSNISEGSQVTFSGVIEGIETYQTDQGENVTAPSMDAKIVNFQTSN
ncbi:hypothetical protein [Leuconostoc lactis]